MKIEFHTADGLIDIKDCPDIDEPVTIVMSPCWSGSPTPSALYGPKRTEMKYPKDFMQYRKYESAGQRNKDGIPIVKEVYAH